MFEQHLDARNLDALVELYDPEARFVAPSGEILTGRERIREVLARLIDAGTHMHGRVVQVITVDDVAVLYTDFEGTARDGAGSTVPVESHAIEVLCRQPDGTWRLIVGDPGARSMARITDRS